MLPFIGSADDLHAGQSDPNELLEADRAFSRWSVEHGVPSAFSAWLAEDAIVLFEGARPLVGRTEIAPILQGWPATTQLQWVPERAEVAASGDMGWTWGRFTRESHGADGQTTTLRGRYVSIWRRNNEGAWRVVLDTGSADPKHP